MSDSAVDIAAHISPVYSKINARPRERRVATVTAAASYDSLPPVPCNTQTYKNVDEFG